jgi:APA family basic amino acid/polyamine antiporter
MARDGLLFGWMGAIHSRFKSPHAAIVAQAIWSSALVLTDTYRALFTRVVFTEWIFFGALALGVVRLRGTSAYAPAFRAWGFPIAPLLFASICLTIVLNQVAAEPRESLTGLALVAGGLPVYYLWGGRRASDRVG